MLALIWGELMEAREQLLDLRRIRVSVDAIEGSPVTVPFTPERARVLALRQYPEGVGADLATVDRWRELLIHPADWMELRRAPAPNWEIDWHSDPIRVWGVPVAR